MAMINCPECGEEVSSEATSCPNCGHPMTKPAGQPAAVLVMAIISIACSVYVLTQFNPAAILAYDKVFNGAITSAENFGPYISNLLIVVGAFVAIVAACLVVVGRFANAKALPAAAFILSAIALVTTVVGIFAYNLWLLMLPLLIAGPLLALLAANVQRKAA